MLLPHVVALPPVHVDANDLFQQAVSFVKSEFSMRFIRLYDSLIPTDKLSTFCVMVELMLFTVSLVAYVSLTVVLNPLTSATKELSLVDV